MDQRPTNLTNNRRIETNQWLMPNFTRVFQPVPSRLNWPIMFNGPTIHLTLKMTSTQVAETSVTNNSSFQNYPHPNDHTILRIISSPWQYNLLPLFLFVFTGIWYTILKAVTKISVVVNVRNVTRVTDPCLLIVTLFDKGFERKITYEKSDIGHDLHRYGLNIMDLTWLFSQ